MNKFLSMIAAFVSCLALLLAGRKGETFQHIDAGGHPVRMLITGRGGPTVVFEDGSGGPLDAWMRVQPEVSEFTSTISYDRAGNGLSPRGPTPRDGRQIAIELRTALRNAHATPPYVLVGHSLGGPFIRVFAGMYPDEVAGMVLVDPTQEELIAWAKARKLEPETEREPRPWDEVDCAPLTFAEAQEHPLPAGIPIVLITGMGPRTFPTFLPKELKEEVRKDRTIFYPAKLKFHRAWVEQYPGGRLVVTKNSGHGVPLEEPDLVVRTIREVVERVRQKRE